MSHRISPFGAGASGETSAATLTGATASGLSAAPAHPARMIPQVAASIPAIMCLFFIPRPFICCPNVRRTRWQFCAIDTLGKRDHQNDDESQARIIQLSGEYSGNSEPQYSYLLSVQILPEATCGGLDRRALPKVSDRCHLHFEKAGNCRYGLRLG